jgi:glycogen operon protein
MAEFHVDGFRFDEASILTRGTDGQPLADPPLLGEITADPLLRDARLIAEPWDPGGLDLVGRFPGGERWSEWNPRYRDALRRFLRGEPHSAREFATRLLGSPDLYRDRGPCASVNYVTAHDGFTLRDLVSYDRKHNEANGEQDRDGAEDELSWNCGTEGPTADARILALREQQQRNALLLLMLSHGIPMLVAGDERGRTQAGNSNAYCHDSELAWVDWDPEPPGERLAEFTRRAIALRRAHPAVRRAVHPDDAQQVGLPPAISWHGAEPWRPDWDSPLPLLAAMYCEHVHGLTDLVYVAANAGTDAAEFRPPVPPPGLAWAVAADTSQGRPEEAARAAGQEQLIGRHPVIRVAARSAMVLAAVAEQDASGQNETKGSL